MSPDISLCLWRQGQCSLAATCYRAQVEPGEWHQSWFAPDERGERCPYYIEDTTKEK